MRTQPTLDAANEIASELVLAPAPAVVPRENLLSRLARRAQAGLGKSRRPIIVWLSNKLRLTINPRPERRISRLTALLLLPFVPSLVQALPVGEQLVGGQATVTRPTATSLTVNQATQKAALDWRNFNIGRGESVVFNQPNAQSVTLNRVLSADPTQIFGSLRANGSVFLVNNAGVYFAPGAAVNVGSFVGSTLSLSTKDFMAGNYTFNNAGNAAGIKNDGTISVQPGGYIGLFGPQVANNGNLLANQGSVSLAAGNRVTMQMGAGGMLNVNVDAAALKASINNSGNVLADGGQVHFSAKSADALLDTVINTSGTVRANSLQQRNGKIVLDGGSSGVVSVSGTLQATNAAGKGGTVQVLGDKVALMDQAKINVSGNIGGGEVLIGGNFQGKGIEHNASMAYIAPKASIQADALDKGDGGKVVVWSDDKTRFDGSISAKGGAQGGNGGFVETSGKQTLIANGAVDASAAKGKGGTWLLDPNDITITNGGADTNISGTSPFLTTDDTATLSNTTLNAALTGGTTVRVQTNAAGTNAQSGNITVDAPVAAAGADATLSLEAQGNIILTSNAQIGGNATKINVDLKAGMDAGFSTPGTNASTITMAAGSSITTDGGAVTATAQGNITLGAIDTSGASLTVDADGASAGAARTITQVAAIKVGDLNITNTSGSTTLDNASNVVAQLGTITATGQTVTLDNSAGTTLTQSGVIKAETLSLTNPNGDVSLNTQANVIADLGVINVGANTFSLDNTGGTTLSQSGVLTAGTLNLKNTAGAVTLSQANDVADLGTINTGANAFTLDNSGGAALTQSGVITTSSLSLVNSGGNAVLNTKANVIADLGAIDVGANTFSLDNTGGTTLSQSGVLTAATLNLKNTNGAVTLSQANDVADLGTINTGANAFTLDNSASGVALSQSGVITTSSLSLTHGGGDVILNTQENAIADLGAIDVGANTFSLDNTGGTTLTQSGVLTAGTLNLKNTAGTATLSQANNVADLGTINTGANAFTLDNSGGTTLTQSGVITTSSLSLTNTGGNASLNTQANAIADLGAIDVGANTFSLDNTGGTALTQSGVIIAGSLNLKNTAGSATLNTKDNQIGEIGTVNVGSNTFSLKNTVALTESASGGITAATLNLINTGGATDLSTGTNAITTLGAVTTSAGGNFSFTNNGDLVTSGSAINAGTHDVSLGVSSADGILTLGTGVITAANLNLTADIMVVENLKESVGTISDTLTIVPADANRGIYLGSGVAGNMNLDADEIAAIHTNNTPNVVIGHSAGTGTVHIDDALNFSGQHVTLRGGDITNGNQTGLTVTASKLDLVANTSGAAIGAATDGRILISAGEVSVNTNNGDAFVRSTGGYQLNASDVGSGTLNLTAGNAVTQGGILKAGSLVVSNSGSTNFSSFANELPSLGSITSSTFSLKTNQALAQTAGMTVTSLNLTNTGGATSLTNSSNSVSNLGAVDTSTGGDFSLSNGNVAMVTTASTINAGTHDIEIDTGTKRFTFGLGAVTANNLTITSNDFSFTSFSGAAVTGAFTWQPKSSLTMDMAGNGSSNIFMGLTEIAKLKASGASSIVLGSSNVSTMTLRGNADFAGKAITFKAGTITDGGSTRIITAQDVNLIATSGDIGGISTTSHIDVVATNVSVTSSGGSAYIKSTAGYNLTASNLGAGSLSLIADGAVSQSGAITASALTVSNTGGATNLGTNANSIGSLGAVTATGQAFSFQTDQTLTQTGVLTAGTLNLTNTGGASTLNQANKVSTLGDVSSTAGNFSLTNTGSSTDLTIAGTINATGHDVTVSTGSNALSFGASSVTADNFDVSTSAKAITQSAALNVTGASSFTAGNAAITLDDAGNSFSGDIKLSNTGTNNVAVTSTSAISLGTSSVGSGTLDLIAGGDISQTGALTQSASAGATSFTAGANKIDLSNTGNSLTGTVSLSNSGAKDSSLYNNAALELGTVSAGSASLSLTAVGGIKATGAITQEASAGAVTIIAGAGEIDLSNASNALTGAVSLSNSGVNAVSLTNNADLVISSASLGSGTLDLTANGSISQTGAITQSGGSAAVSLTAANGKDIALGGFANDFYGPVSIVASSGALNDVALRNDNASASLFAMPSGIHDLTLTFTNAGIDLPTTTLTAGGSLNLTTGGDITQSGVLTVPGTTTINASGNAIALASFNNSLTGTVVMSNSGNHNVALKTNGALNMGAFTVGSGSLTLTADGDISQSAALTQEASAGATSITAGAHAITLTQNNQITGTLSLSNSGANNVAVTNTKAIQLDTVSLGSGDLTLHAGEGISQTSAMSVGGIATLDAGAGAIALGKDNTFDGQVVLSNSGANNVSLKTTGALDLGAASVGSGTLSITASGDISQSGALVQEASAGTSTFTAGAGKIILDHASNSITGSLGLSNSGANDVTVVNTGALDLAASSIGSGSLSLTAAGDISQSGTITQEAGAGAITINAGAHGVALGDTSNSLTGVVSISNSGANDVALATNGALGLGTLAVGSGKLDITSNGAMSQTGSIIQEATAGVVSINAGAGSITLENASNDFTGNLSLSNTGSNNVSVVDANSVVLGAGTIGKNLDLKVAGDVSQNGALTVAGTTTVTVDTVQASVDLSNSNNDFTGNVGIEVSNGGSLLDVGIGSKNATANAISLPLGTSLRDLTLNFSQAAVDLSETTLLGNLSVTAGGDITQSGVLTVPGTSQINAGANAIKLDSFSNVLGGTVTLNNSGANNVALKNTGNLELGTSAVGTGTLTIQAGGDISQTGALTQQASAGKASFDAGAHAITLDHAGNDFTGSLSLNNSGANAVTVVDATGLKLATSSIGSGALSITTDGDLTQSGSLTQEAGATTSKISVGAHALSLNNASNSLTSTIELSNSGANNVALTNTTGLTLGALTLGSGSLTVSADGDISQTAALTQEASAGATSFSAGANKITLDHASNSITGSLGLSNSGAKNITVVNTGALDLAASSIGSGSLSLTAAGDISQSGAIGQEASAGAITIAAGAHGVALGNTSNSLTGTVSISNSGANDVALATNGALGLGTLAVGSGKLDITSSGAISQTGSIVQEAAAGAVSINAGAGAITLQNASNDFTGALSLNNTGSGNSVNVVDANGVVLAGGSIGKNLSLKVAGDVSQTGALTVAGSTTVTVDTVQASVDLSNSNNDFTGNVGIAVTNGGTLQDVGIGSKNATANAISLPNGTSLRDLTLNFSAASVDLPETTLTRNLSVTAVGVTQSGVLTVPGTSQINAGANAIVLNSFDNVLDGTVTLNNSGANNVSLKNTGALELGASSVGSGSLTIQAGGAISQTGAIIQAASAGTASFSAGANAITLNNASNDFTGGLSLNNSGANNVSVVDANAVSLATSSIGSGTLSITAGGDLSQTGGLTQEAGAGASSFNVGAHALNLNNASNSLTGTIALTNSGANDVSLSNTAGLSLGTLSLGSGSLTISADGDITQTGGIIQEAAAGAVSVSAGSGAITLENAANAITGTLSLNNSAAQNVSLHNSAGLTMATSSVGKNLSLQAAGDISQTGGLTVAGDFSAVVDTATNATIDLSNGNNDFSGAITFSAINGGSVLDVGIGGKNSTLGSLSLPSGTFRNLTYNFSQAAVDLGTTTITGNLSVTAGGAITQTGILTVPGTASFNTGGFSIALPLANVLSDAVSISNSGANNVTLNNSKDLDLGTIAVGSGSLTVSAAGKISQSAAISQAASAGTASFSAGANTITLDNASNDFTGALALSNSGANNISVVDANALVLGTSSVGTGTLSITAGGDISQTGAIAQTAGAGAVSVVAGAHAISLDHASNAFTGALDISNSGANDVSIVNNAALQLGTVAVGSGSLSVSSSGALTQSNAITQAASAGTASFSAGANAITLSNASNNLTGAVSLTNSGANNISLNNNAALDLAASSVGTGTVSLTAAGDVTQSGAFVQAASGGALTVNAGAHAVSLDHASNDFTGAVNINNSGTNAVSLVDSNALNVGALNVGDGTLSIQSNGAMSQSGAITQSGAAAVTLNSGAGSMSLNNASNALLGAVSLNNTGANNLSLNNNGALDLAASAVGSGTLSITAAGAISQSGAIVQAASAGAASFNAGANTINLSNVSNDFTGAVSLNNSGANDVSLRDVNALDLGTSAVGSGNLSVQSGGALSQSGAISQAASAASASFNVGANSINLSHASNSLTASVTLNNSGANNVSLNNNAALDLAASSVGSGTLTISAAGDLTQSGALTQEASAGLSSFSSGAHAISLNHASNALTGAVSLNNSGANNVSLNNNAALLLASSAVGTGTLSLTANGAISQTGGVVQSAGAGTASFNAGANAIDLSHSSNDFTGGLSVSNSGNNNVTLNDQNALNLGSVAIGTGTLTVTAGGDISQSGAFSQTGTGAISVDAGANAISLSNSGNDFQGAISLNNTGAHDVAVVDTNALNLAASTVGQNLTVTAGGNIAQSGVLNVAGTANFVVDTATNTTLDVGTHANQFGGISISTTNGASIDDVSIRNASASAIFPSMSATVKNLNLQFDAAGISLPTLSLSGNLSVITAGDISQAGALSIDGTSSFDAGAHAITLTQAGNALTGAVTLANSGANNVSLVNASALTIASANLGSGSLSLTSGGDLTQSGSILQAASAGAVTLNAGTNQITLTDAGNDFTGAVSLNNSGAKDISLVDSNALVLGSSSVGSGTLSVTAGGDLSQTGGLVQASGAGAASFTVGAHAISLNNASNDFKGAVNLSNSGNHAVSLNDANSLNLGRIDVGTGALSLSSTGAMTQSDKVTQGASAGAVTINAGAGSITLSNANNSFTGAVGINNTGANNVALTNAGALNIGSSSVGSGTLSVVASGVISQSGAILQAANAGAASFSAGANAITLSNANNDFTGSVNLSNSGNNDVSLKDKNALDVGTFSVGSGTLSVSADGDITQSGIITQAASAGTASFDAGAHAISLSHPSNDFTGSVSLNNSGANNVLIKDVNALDLGTSTLGTGSLSVTTGGAITQSGAIVQAASAGAANFDAAANPITLTNAGNDFTGTVNVSNSGANNVSVTDANDITFGTSTIGQDMFIVAGNSVTLGNMTFGRNLDIQTGGNVSQTNGTGLTVNGTSTFTANGSKADIVLDGLNQFEGKVAVVAGTGGSVRTVTVRNTAMPAANPDLPLNLTNLTLQFDNAPLNLPATSVSGNLSAIAGGDITQSGALQVTGTANFNAGANSITLENTGNDFVGAVSLSNSGDHAVSIVDKNGIEFGTTNLGTGTFSASALSGSITQSGAIKQANGSKDASFNAVLGAITLDHASNDFSGALNLSNTGLNSITVNNDDALILGTLKLGKDLAVQAKGNITQSKALTSSGDISLTIANTTGDVLLNHADNDFSSTISVLAGTGGTVNHVSVLNNNSNVSVPVLPASGVSDLTLEFDNAALNLPALNIGGNLNVKTGGPLTQSGSLVIGGTSTLNAQANPIVLENTSNAFTGALSLYNTGANNISIKTGSALNLGTSNIGSGSLIISATGKISQSGILTQEGAGAMTISSDDDIELINANNVLLGTVALHTTGAHNAKVSNKDAITLGASSVGQNLAVTAGGNITQAGALTVGGTSTFTVTGSAADISLASQANDLTGSVIFAGNLHDVELRNISNTANLPSMPATSFHNLTFQFDNTSVTLPETVLTGDLRIVAGGDIAQTGKFVVPGSTILTAGGKITANNANNDFTGDVSLTNTGKNDVQITDINALQLAAANLGSGSLTVKTGGNLSQSGAIVQAANAGNASFNAGANTLTLTNANNDFTGNVLLNNSGSKDVSLTDKNTLVLGASTVGKDLHIVAGGNISQTGTLSVPGAATFTMNTATNQNVSLAGFPNIFAGSVAISNGSGTIADVELRNASATGTGNLTLPTQLRNLTLNYDASGMVLSGATLSGKLEAIAGGNISQSGALAVGGTASFNAGAHSITLDNASNDFSGAVKLSNTGANNVALTDANGVLLDAINVGSGTLTIKAGAISQLAAITQASNAGAATFNSAGAITLTNTGNDFTGPLSLIGSGTNAISIVDKNALSIGQSSIGSGKLEITAGGALTQTGAIVQATNATGATFNVGANTITLANEANDFTGPVSLNNTGGNDVSLRDANTLVLGESQLGAGKLTIQSNGSLTQTGAVQQEASAGAVNINAGAGAITLTHEANSLTGAVSLNNSGANNVSLNNARALVLAGSQLGSGQLNLTASGAISQTGAIVQSTGASGVTINAGANSIDLSDDKNDFVGDVSVNNSGSNDVSIADLNDIKLAASNLGNGNLTVTAGGKIEQSGAITQAAAASGSSAVATFNAVGNAINLSNNANDFTTAVSLNGAEVQLNDKNGLNLGKGTVSANLSVKSNGGNISQSGALAVKGNANFDAGSGEIKLDQAGNDLATVDLKASKASIISANDLTLSAAMTGAGELTANSKALKLGNISASSFSATASGDVSQKDVSQVAITGNTTINAGSNNITLTNTSNDFNTLELSAGKASVSDSNALSLTATTTSDLSTSSGALDFKASSIGGNLSSTASGAVSQSGALKVTGTSTIAAAGNAVTLTAANDFKGAVSVSNTGSGNAVQLKDSNAIVLGNISTDGALSVNAVGISQAAAVTGLLASEGSSVIVGGNASLNAGAGTIALENSGNDFVGTLSLSNSGNNAVAVADTNALKLGALAVGGALKVTAGGDISQSEALKLAGSSSFDAGTHAVTLNHADNDFTGAVKLTGGVSQINASKQLNVNFNTSGATTVAAGGDLSISGSAASLTSTANKTIFGATSVAQILNLNANGTVSQTGALKVGGATNIKGGTGLVDLSNTGNDFTGLVTLNGAANITDANALNAVINDGTDVSLVAGGALDVSGSSTNLSTSAVGKSQFGDLAIASKLSLTTLGGDLVVLDGKKIDAAEVNLIMPKTFDLGSSSNQFSLNDVESVLVVSGRNGFLQIPLNSKVRTNVKVGTEVTGCVRVNMGSCINGSALISGAISAVQSAATGGLSSKLQKDDASTKKLTYGFAGDLQQVQTYPHQGALEILPIPSCRTGNTIGGEGKGLAVENGIDCGSVSTKEVDQDIKNGTAGDLKQVSSLPHEGALELKTLPTCTAAEAAALASSAADKAEGKPEAAATCVPATPIAAVSSISVDTTGDKQTSSAGSNPVNPSSPAKLAAK